MSTATPTSSRPRPTPATYRRRRLAVAGGALALVAVVVLAVVLATGGSGSSGYRPAVTTGTHPAPAATPVYAAAGANMLSPTVASDPYRLYVPESTGTGIDVIDPTTQKVIAHYPTGLEPQHVVPAYDLRTLWVTNDKGNSLTPIDPAKATPGPPVPVEDPYNLYFTPDGKFAIVVAEALKRLDFRDPHTMQLVHSLSVDGCAGVDHMDFSADGSYLIASCEFGGRLVKVDLRTQSVTGYLDLAGSSPQDVRLDNAGTTFYVADKNLGGVHLIDASSFSQTRFIPTGKDAHGIYPSRDGTHMYVSNRGAGSISVIDAATQQPVATWVIPGGGSPDMGGVSSDGTVLWFTGRYNAEVYGLSAIDGHLVARIHVPNQPHGMCVWPQPGRYSLGHTGNMR